MDQMEPYLFFDGTCAEAMRFYERTLGGKIETIMTNAEAPDQARTPPGGADRIMHASLVVNGKRLMASDWMPGQAYPGMGGFRLSLVYPTVEQARKVFDELSKNGTVAMQMEKTFWVESFGMVTDRFGTPWMVSGGQQSKP